MDNQTKEQIRDLVAKARLDKALKTFNTWASANGQNELRNTVSTLQSDFSDMESDLGIGVLSSSEANQRRNKIASNVLKLLDKTDDLEPAEPTSGTKTGTQAAPTTASSSNGTILFLAANPTDTAKLQLDNEFTKVFKSIGDNRITYNLEAEFAVTASLLQTALLKYRPRIVHFSGHGDGGDGDVPTAGGGQTRAGGRMPQNRAGIVLQTSDGQSQLVSGMALAALFKVCLKIFKLEVVLLNACSSEEQAAAIFNAGVPYVIGMNTSVKDTAAIQFSAKFYEGLASEGNVEIAFELAKVGVMMENGFTNDADIPVLYKKDV